LQYQHMALLRHRGAHADVTERSIHDRRGMRGAKRTVGGLVKGGAVSVVAVRCNASM
jgi:hypothetical protein